MEEEDVKGATMTNFAQQLSAAAAKDPDHPAVKLDEVVLT